MLRNRFYDELGASWERSVFRIVLEESAAPLMKNSGVTSYAYTRDTFIARDLSIDKFFDIYDSRDFVFLFFSITE